MVFSLATQDMPIPHRSVGRAAGKCQVLTVKRQNRDHLAMANSDPAVIRRRREDVANVAARVPALRKWAKTPPP